MENEGRWHFKSSAKRTHSLSIVHYPLPIKKAGHPKMPGFWEFLSEFLGDLDDVACAQAELLQNLDSGAGVAELVVDTDTLDGNRIVLAQAAADSLAQAADDLVFLAGDDLAALLGSSDDQRFVQGLDGGHVDDHGIDTGLSQLFAGLDGS